MAEILRGMGNILRDDAGGSSGGGTGVGDLTPVGFEGTVTGGWNLVDADHPVTITVLGAAKTNATGDPGTIVLIASHDDGATGTYLCRSPVTTIDWAPYSVSGVIPAGWKVHVDFTQQAAGQNGSFDVQTVTIQPFTA